MNSEIKNKRCNNKRNKTKQNNGIANSKSQLSQVPELSSIGKQGNNSKAILADWEFIP